MAIGTNYTFKRGVRLPGHKERTAGEAVRLILPKPGQELIFPMRQHIGAACVPVVEAGQKVLAGQKIGDSADRVSVPVHSSVSGTVTAVGRALAPDGMEYQAVTVESGGAAAAGGNPGRAAYSGRIPEKDELLRVIREAGIAGMGGAGFPAHVKLDPPPGLAIDTVVVNGAECEPYLAADHRALLERANELAEGLGIILSLFPGARGLIAAETDKPGVIAALMAAAADKPRIGVRGLPPKYPQGSEKQLIFACAGREVPSGGLPRDVGCLAHNAGTVIAIYEAVVLGRPLTRRIVTVAGGAVKNPGNYEVCIGTKFSDLMEDIGGFSREPYRLVCGGPMMGAPLYTLDVPVTKTASALLCLTEEEAPDARERNCIRCGRCVEYCPMGLAPVELNKAAIGGEKAVFEKKHGRDCIECGSCSYVCPAKRHLAQSIKEMKRGK